jgi:hypothetical protein
VHLNFYSRIVFDCLPAVLRTTLQAGSPRMKISTDDQKAIGLILICVGFLFFLIGLAAHLKESFQSRAEISTVGFTAAAIAAALGIIFVLFSLRRKQG